MPASLRLLLTVSMGLLAAPCLLQAESGNWGGEIGMVSPMGGTRTWTGSTVGPALDITESYPLGQRDAIRMRFGYWDVKASSSQPQLMVVPGYAAASYPAATTNEAFGFSYGAEYVRNLTGSVYVLGGLGVNYLTVTRSGTFDLTAAGSTSTAASFGANSFVPYACLGLGCQLTHNLAVEARYQTSSLKAQNRGVDLSNAGIGSPGQASVDKLTLSTLSIGLALAF